MQKRFNPILDELPPPFYEDVYLLDKRGNVISGRQGSDRNINNIFSIIDSREISFIQENTLFSDIHPLLLVSSSQGPMLLNYSLFLQNRVFMAIIPHFPIEQTLELIKSELRFVLPSPLMKTKLDATVCHELNLEQKVLANRLDMFYRMEMNYSRVHGRTNVELAEMMFDIAHDISNFVGCQMDCDVHGIAVFELQNELCMNSYKFMLTVLCFAARNYSEQRCAKADIYFDEIGISMRISFEIADVYRNQDLATESPELVNLINEAQNDQFMLEYFENDGELSICGYLWQRSVEFEHIKKKYTELIYKKTKGE